MYISIFLLAAADATDKGDDEGGDEDDSEQGEGYPDPCLEVKAAFLVEFSTAFPVVEDARGSAFGSDQWYRAICVSVLCSGDLIHCTFHVVVHVGSHCESNARGECDVGHHFDRLSSNLGN